MITFLCTVVLDFTIGLLAGIGAAMLSIVLRGFFAKGQVKFRNPIILNWPKKIMDFKKVFGKN